MYKSLAIKVEGKDIIDRQEVEDRDAMVNNMIWIIFYGYDFGLKVILIRSRLLKISKVLIAPF